jgi:hypothetical protein
MIRKVLYDTDRSDILTFREILIAVSVTVTCRSTILLFMTPMIF